MLNSGAVLYLAHKLKDGYIYDERYYNELLKLLKEQVEDNFYEIARCAIDALRHKNEIKIKMSQ